MNSYYRKNKFYVREINDFSMLFAFVWTCFIDKGQGFCLFSPLFFLYIFLSLKTSFSQRASLSFHTQEKKKPAKKKQAQEKTKGKQNTTVKIKPYLAMVSYPTNVLTLVVLNFWYFPNEYHHHQHDMSKEIADTQTIDQWRQLERFQWPLTIKRSRLLS